MDAPWHIRLLGELRVEMGETTVSHFATSRVAALLARLALYPRRAHSREELCDLLWPEAEWAAGRLNLRVAIASLRRQMEPPPIRAGSVLVADRSFVGLNPAAFRCDVTEFEAAGAKAMHSVSPSERREALAQAAALYQGHLLPSFYDDWIGEERERLRALHAELCLMQGDPDLQTPAVSLLPKAGLGAVPVMVGVAPAPRSLRLPPQFTRFFGREQDCLQIAELFGAPATRLVTLTGPGGVGKTRLAVEAARQCVDGPDLRFRGPVCFVPLADLSETRLTPAAIAAALKLDRTGDADPLDQIVFTLAALPPALLVLDNFEHLVERGASLILSLLTRLPALTCLVTSRLPLSLPGEIEYPVASLPVPPLPPADVPETLEQVTRVASAQLFVDRAQAVRPEFQLTPANTPAVAALCRRLEGVPLALELVAARAIALSPAQMNERLSRSFSLLNTQPSAQNGCCRPVWAAAAWSYDLLPPPLQRFFAGLTVFRGGCTVESAQAILEEPQALAFLTQLRERSLVTVEQVGAEPCFRLLETLREFAGEQLSETDRMQLWARHSEYFLGLGQTERTR